MNRKTFGVMLGAAVLGALLPIASLAQGPLGGPGGPPPGMGPGGPGPGGFGMGRPGAPVTGRPYAAQVTLEHTQVLSDGNRIERKTTSQVYRDSQGRVRWEDAGGQNTAAGGGPQRIMITDPVAGAVYVLDPTRKTAVKRLLPQRKTAEGNPRPARPFNGNGNGNRNADAQSLGGKNIEGVYVEGTQITRTVPAGRVGNSAPIQTVSSRWHSPDLDVDVQALTTDPLRGDTSLTLSGINRSEPDTSLFIVPPDYTVSDVGSRRGPRPGPPGPGSGQQL